MKIGTIGTGMIVERFLDAVNAVDGAECVAIYSRTKENGERLGAKFHVECVYTELDEMLKDDKIDFIYIASPNSLHYEQCKKAMEYGKHVICEKPFTSNKKELEELMQYAKEKNLFLFEAITTIHLPNAKYLKAKLEENKIGQIKLVQCNYSQYSARYAALCKGEMTNIFDLNYSGGALVDLNIYNIHFVVYLFGEPEQVHYFPNKHSSGVDTSGVAVLDYGNFKAICSGAKDADGENICTIQAENGGAVVFSQASLCRSVKYTAEHESYIYGVQEQENVLYYELTEFVRIYSNNDYKQCHELLKHSSFVMNVLTKARESGGIVYPSDSI